MVRLGTDELVPALNEQLTHRRKGNDLYKAKKFKAALKCYTDALAICNFVVRAPLTRDRHPLGPDPVFASRTT